MNRSVAQGDGIEKEKGYRRLDEVIELCKNVPYFFLLQCTNKGLMLGSDFVHATYDCFESIVFVAIDCNWIVSV